MAEDYKKAGSAKPNIVVLGSNFGGLTAARFIRKAVGDKANITVIDRKPYLLFVPNIPLTILKDGDPAMQLHLDFLPFYKEDKTVFIQAEVKAIDPESKVVEVVPSERPGAAMEKITFDYLVIALGAKLDYDSIPGFGEFGHTLSDSVYGNKLRRYLFGGNYKGGPVAMGSARFKQGTLDKPDWMPIMSSACDGPILEFCLGFSTWMADHKAGTPKNITLFCQDANIAEDAGKPLYEEFLGMVCGKMGMGYRTNTYDIKEITKEGIKFVNGPDLEAELKIILPNWAPHTLLKDMPFADEVGFVIADEKMHVKGYENIFVVGDSAAMTAPKLGAMGDQQARITAQQLKKALGLLPDTEEEKKFDPILGCYGDMGHHNAFYIQSNLVYGGNIGFMKMGPKYYGMKIAFKDLYYLTGGAPPAWGMDLANIMDKY